MGRASHEADTRPRRVAAPAPPARDNGADGHERSAAGVRERVPAGVWSSVLVSCLMSHASAGVSPAVPHLLMWACRHTARQQCAVAARLLVPAWAARVPVLDWWHVQEGVRFDALGVRRHLGACVAFLTSTCPPSLPRPTSASDDCSHLHRYIPSRMEPCQYLQRDGVCNKPNCEFMHEEGEAGTGRKVGEWCSPAHVSWAAASGGGSLVLCTRRSFDVAGVCVVPPRVLPPRSQVPIPARAAPSVFGTCYSGCWAVVPCISS